MKVERIFALQKMAMEKKEFRQRTDVDIQLLNIPYRHEATYPVTLDELMTLLENLIGTIANPRSRKGLRFEPVEVPDFKDYFTTLENIIEKYEAMIVRKIERQGFGFLHSIIADLDTTDSIRCFFAILFLAKEHKVDLEQEGDDIKIILIKEEAK
jgi:segregation and condensation protein A